MKGTPEVDWDKCGFKATVPGIQSGARKAGWVGWSFPMEKKAVFMLCV